MRRKDKQITDLNTIHEVIYRAQVCRVAMVDGNKPYIIPVSFGFDGKHIYFHSALAGRKVELLKANNNICVEFEENLKVVAAEKPCHWGVNYRTVIGQGIAELVTDLPAKSHGLCQIVSHYDQNNREYFFSEEELASVLLYRIILSQITGKVSG